MAFGILIAAAAGSVIAVWLMATRPILAVFQNPPKGGESAPAARVRRELTPLYDKLLEGIAAGNPSPLSRIVAPDFTYESLYGDRTYELDRNDWENTLRNYGRRISQMPASVRRSGLQMESRRRFTIQVGRIEVMGDRAVVDAVAGYEYARTRYPTRTRYVIRQETVSQDTWERRGGGWRLAGIKALKVRQVRESQREQPPLPPPFSSR